MKYIFQNETLISGIRSRSGSLATHQLMHHDYETFGYLSNEYDSSSPCSTINGRQRKRPRISSSSDNENYSS